MNNKSSQDSARVATLGQLIKKARTDLQMSQRDVEQATGKEVSNAYLSQLESGKVTKPSPHILRTLADALHITYETLMERAGYIAPKHDFAPQQNRTAAYSVTNLSAEEEGALLDYLGYLRSRK